MKKPRDRLQEARASAGYDSPTAAASAFPRDINKNTLISHENGNRELSRKAAEKYAKLFNVDAGWLLYGSAHSLNVNETSPGILQNLELPNAIIRDKVEGLGRTIPVYGQAVGGVDGEFLMNGSVLYEVKAPPAIASIPDAYAVQVAGDSMSPRYDDGEICYVDPRRRVKKGDYVIVQIRNDEHGPLLAYVKKFIRQNSIELVLEQFNPAKELRFASGTVVSVHYITLAGNG
ncbi:helix-turn-helix transcriptional regulator [Rhizobium laguerreae]|uniref:LexA family transcriptional regulator n=1 Tax=Rhizobium TaxID=379 RepID=UPI001C91A79C|nr:MULTISPECIES: helix-turn-helix transcriptional regulator [Rhizobium]MBY3073430.1 helix-turn-helix transcriptional regulator [Rhizobium laguerreae]MBY5821454.1 helix-turn-helix transcriptional regulator [Rhizobium leguminosarum]